MKIFPILIIFVFIIPILFSPFRNLGMDEFFVTHPGYGGNSVNLQPIEIHLFFYHWLSVLIGHILGLISWRLLSKNDSIIVKMNHHVKLLQIFSIIGIIAAFLSSFPIILELLFLLTDLNEPEIPIFIIDGIYVIMLYNPGLLAGLCSIGYFIMGIRLIGISRKHGMTTNLH